MNISLILNIVSKKLILRKLKFGLELCERFDPFVIVRLAECLEDDVVCATSYGFYFEYVWFLVFGMRNFYDFEVLEGEELHFFLAWLFHVDEADCAEDVESLVPFAAAEDAVAALVEVAGLVRHQVVARVQVLHHVSRDSGLRIHVCG